MTQDQWVILLLKIGVIAGFISLVSWIVVYSLLADWRHNAIGRTLVAKTALIAMLLIPFSLSLFFRLNRLDSRATAWADVVLIGAITPVMLWRIAVWLRLSHGERGSAAGEAEASGTETERETDGTA